MEGQGGLADNDHSILVRWQGDVAQPHTVILWMPDRGQRIDVIAEWLVRLHDSGGQRHQVPGSKPGPAVQQATPLRGTY